MSSTETPSKLFDAYQTVAQDLLPPALLLEGEFIVETIGKIEQLLRVRAGKACNRSVHLLPNGEVKSELLRIVTSCSDGVPVDGCQANGMRVVAIPDPPEKNRILVVFDTAVLNKSVEELSAKSTMPESDFYDPFLEHLIGCHATPRVMIWETDSTGAATYISRSEVEYTGRPVEDLLGQGWIDDVHSQDVNDCLETFGQAAELRQPFSFASRRRRFDGEYFWFQTHGVPQFDSESNFIGFRGFCLDCSRQSELQYALATNQRLMRSVLDNSPYLCAYVDRDMRYQYANNKYADFWQTPIDQIIGSTVAELTGEFFDPLKPFLDRALSGETVHHEMVAPSGESAEDARWLDIVHVPAFDVNETVIGFYCFINDVTDTRKHERLLQLVQDNVPAMVFLLNTRLEIRHANSQLLNRLKKGEAEVTGKPLCDTIGSETFADFEEQLQSALSGEKCAFETKLKPVAGKPIDVIAQFVPEFDEKGKVIGVCGLMLDISELRNVQVELQRTEARFDLAVSGSSLGIFEFDPKRPDLANCDHVEDLLGFDRGELENSRAKIRELIHPDDREHYYSCKSSPDENGQIRVEIRLKNKANCYRWYELFSQPIFPSHAENGFRAGTIVDIDDLKTAQLESAAQVRRRDEFLAMLSHELRNPMAAIVLSLDNLDGPTSVPPELDPIIDVLKRQSSQISHLLDDLLDVSRVTHNRIEFKKCIHNFNSSVVEVASSHKLSAHRKRQSLTISPCKQPLLVDGDESRLKQVVGNLVENAIKYTPEGGNIWVTTKLDESNLVMSVRDTGIGIANDMIERIFELFSQGESTIHRTSGGMGVGLFMVKHIIQAHQGIVTVSSNGCNQGSQFDVRIPISDKMPLVPPTSMSPFLSRLNLALVEDNVDTRSMITRLLRQRGLDVVEFADGETASQDIPKFPPDVAIIDIGLPGKSGFDLAREFRHNKKLDQTMLIAMTGYGQGADQETALSAGFDLHLVKPTDIDKLATAIATWTANRRSRAAS